MIISRAPFRISFFGGGTDYPVWYREHGGAVLATSINKYCYVTARYLPPFFNYRYRIRYTEREEVKEISQIKHPSVRECLNHVTPDGGVEIQHNADLPARIGLGSSSTFTVSLLHALYALKGKMVTKRQLAMEAIHLEQDIIKENVGSQDQTSAAFGGLNKITFGGQNQILVEPLTLEADFLDFFQSHLMLFFTGFNRTASDIAEEQIRNTPKRRSELERMLAMVDQAIAILNSGIRNLDDFGRLLGESWMLKRHLTDRITNHDIDDIYETATKAGALGGKLLGAGGGGCILFFVRPEEQAKVRDALSRFSRLLPIPFKFENLGSQIIYYAPQSDFY
ncbi:MAG: GHMP kinase [Dehalococcoidales bacterium]|jgi:D-glycero-alpha-D-manno-heptose-7-phosphate kinase